MSVLDKFLNVMRLSPDDEDDFYNEEYDYDEDYEEKPSKAKSSFRKKDRKDDESVMVEDKPVREKQQPAPVVRTAQKAAPVRQFRRASSNNINMEVCVIKPTSVEDGREITETLLSERAVVLNVEGLNVETAQRIIDFASGSCYAINGNLQKISNYIFIITPASVDLSGDFSNIVDSIPGGLNLDF
jgi:cell division inhibitor SepF